MRTQLRCSGSRSVLAALAALVFVCGAAACDSSSGSSAGTAGGSGTSAPTTPSARTVVVPPSCSLAPVEVVDHTLEATVNEPRSQRNGSIRTCTYPGPPGGDDVVIRLQAGVTAAEFATAEESLGPTGRPGTRVAGLGDAAYSTSRGEPGNELNTLAVLSGSTEVSISAPVPLAQLDALARTLLDRL